MVDTDTAIKLQLDELGEHWQQPNNIANGIYLGLHDARHIFAVALPDTLPPDGPSAEVFDNFRGLMGGLSSDDAALLAYAKGMVEWQQRHRFCGECGSRNTSVEGGFVMQCSDTACATRSFPRLDPAIIVLVTQEDRCLLGRQSSWPEGRYSTIAGFVEPGESLEDAVRREVHEETNIGVGNTRYLGSQPWPFPNAIMLGFHADAVSTDIRLNDGELADARWFRREDLANGTAALPPPQSIAFRLIEKWFDQGDSGALAEFKLSTDFTRKPDDQSGS
jgi:NAD+ diphosphatase